MKLPLLAAALGLVPIAAVAAGQAPAPAEPQVAFPGQYALAPAEWKYPVWPSGCNRFAGDERAACLEFVSSDYGRLSRYAAANAALGAPRAGEGRVVFFGDSITDNWSKPGVRRLLSRAAVRQPRHRGPDDRADARPIPRRRARAAARGRRHPRGDERRRRQLGTRRGRRDRGQPRDHGRAREGPRREGRARVAAPDLGRQEGRAAAPRSRDRRTARRRRSAS